MTISIITIGCERSDPPPEHSSKSEVIDVQEAGDGLDFQFELDLKSGSSSDGPLAVDLSYPAFTDVAEAWGIRHVYDNGTSRRQLMSESTGGGAGWFDVDRDGLIDLYLTQGGDPTPEQIEDREPDRFYRQHRSGKSVDIAELAAITGFEYGQGVASADVDNDGFSDLLVTNIGRNRFLRNNGDGTLSECDERVMQDSDSWSTSAAFGDVDQDGDLDLYVCNYAEYDPYNPRECLDEEGIPSVCHPRNVPSRPDDFYLNDGDGSFKKCDAERGLFGPENRALCVVMLDLNRDGALDIYVGNDTTPNFLYLNDGTGHFTESALGMGGAVSATGASQASMGIGVGDFDHNGFQDLCITHFTGEYNTLYQNNGPGGFRDLTSLSGLRPLTLTKLAFGAIMHDFNADGFEDQLFANGHIDPRHPDGDGYEMCPQLVSYDGHQWRDGSEFAGLSFREKGVGRGLAAADFDNDGDMDVAMVRQNSECLLLRNDSNPVNTLRLFLVGVTSNRDALGTYVTMDFGDDEIHQQALFCGESFSVANEMVVEFAVPSGAVRHRCEVQWPDGQAQAYEIPSDLRSALLIQDDQCVYPRVVEPLSAAPVTKADSEVGQR